MILSWQDIKNRQLSLSWLGLLAIVCSGCGAEWENWERIQALIPGICMAWMSCMTQEALGEGDALLAGCLGLGFRLEETSLIVITALLCGAVTGMFFLVKQKRDEIPFAPFLLFSWMLWQPLL